MTLTGIKLRAYPTDNQKQVLSQWMGCARVIYNAKCSEDHYFRTFLRKSLTLTGHPIPVDQSYSQFKSDETPWLSACPSQILRNSAVIWYQAYQRFFQGLSGRPVAKKKGRKDSIWLTSELFTLEEVEGEWKLLIGTKTRNVGYLSFEAHREFKVPKSLRVSRLRGEYYVSFSYEEDRLLSDPWEQVSDLIIQGEATLKEACSGNDRGVKIPVVSSRGERYDFTPEQKKTIRKKKKQIRKNQKRVARQKKGSKRQEKVKRQIAKDSAKLAHVREDFAHQSSCRLVKGQESILVWEGLRVKDMTKRPAPKVNVQGKYLPNRARAKAGLNEAILDSCWGQLLKNVGYKAKRIGKLVLLVSAYGSSQECVECHHTHPANRVSQSVFKCVGCGYSENADVNASQIIEYRGVKALLEHPKEDWNEISEGIWKISISTRGTRGSAQGGKRQTQKQGADVRSQRSANRVSA
jgi:putative transposase